MYRTSFIWVKCPRIRKIKSGNICSEPLYQCDGPKEFYIPCLKKQQEMLQVIQAYS